MPFSTYDPTNKHQTTPILTSPVFVAQILSSEPCEIG